MAEVLNEQFGRTVLPIGEPSVNNVEPIRAVA
jgi:hypothetical protein